MPRKSLCRKTLDFMEARVQKLRLRYYLRQAMDNDNSSDEEELLRESDVLNKMKNSQYMYQSST